MTGRAKQSTYLTVTAAAARVERSRRQVERWIVAGLPVHWVGNIRYVAEDDLLRALRRHILANPTRRDRD